MTQERESSDSNLVAQEHCIDLPGETVQCWIGAGTDKLKVILRKHRDVIFDIHLGNGKTYTLDSTESDFYSPRDKKIILAPLHGKVTFKDGERFHVWISRDFRGALVLKSEGRAIYKIEPNKWDKQEYSDDPKEKPAPIIIAIGADITTSTSIKKPADQPIFSASPKTAKVASVITPTRPTSMHAPDLSCPVICVVDGKAEGMPEHIVEYFKKGGDHSGFSDMDPNHVPTRNWIWGQVTGGLAYIRDNWEWLRASLDGKINQNFKLVKAQVHYVQGRVRFYFSGYSNSNTIFGRGGFGPSHDRIMTIFSGTGKTTSTFGSALKGIASTFENAALVSFIFGTATTIAEWKNDVSKDGYDLAAALITTTIKSILTAAIVTLVTAIIVWLLMIVLGAAVPVIAIGALSLSIGVLANYVVESADKLAGRTITHDESNTDGTASVISEWMRKSGNSALERVQQNWRYLMLKMTRDYQEIIF